jgi:hypothetical protein
MLATSITPLATRYEFNNTKHNLGWKYDTHSQWMKVNETSIEMNTILATNYLRIRSHTHKTSIKEINSSHEGGCLLPTLAHIVHQRTLD